MDSSDELLDRALTIVRAAGAEVAGYGFAPVGGSTQAIVWRGTSPLDVSADVALRLTPKPVQLITRIAALIDAVTDVACPRTLAVGQVDVEGRPWTVHLCTWIGTGAPQRPDMRHLGQHLARLHLALAESSIDVMDRRLTFERAPAPDLDQGLPAWDVARQLWSDRICAGLSLQTHQDGAQPIHGDMHWGNIVATGTGFGFIDFDKAMFAAPVFDLAKLIATGLFTVEDRARFHARRTAELLQGYESLRVLSEAELVGLEGLVVLMNEETARLGDLHDDDAYRTKASAIARWWITRRRQAPHDPLRIRSSRWSPESDLGKTRREVLIEHLSR